MPLWGTLIYLFYQPEYLNVPLSFFWPGEYFLLTYVEWLIFTFHQWLEIMSELWPTCPFLSFSIYRFFTFSVRQSQKKSKNRPDPGFKYISKWRYECHSIISCNVEFTWNGEGKNYNFKVINIKLNELTLQFNDMTKIIVKISKIKIKHS